jgi:nitroreductase
MTNKFKIVYDTTLSRRSIRRFKHGKISINILKKLVNSARLAPSAANLQPLEFFIVNDEKLCEKCFQALRWAGYLKNWNPSKNESPKAYILILVKDEKNPWILRDTSFAAGNIVTVAEGADIGSCIICNINRDMLREILSIPDDIIIDSIIALGYKAEQPVVEDFKDNVKYWRDENGILHVPKRKLEGIIHINKY